MSRSVFFIIGALIGLMTFSPGCGKAKNRTTEKQVTDRLPSIDAKKFKELFALSGDALMRKAAAGQLGNCVGEYTKSIGCESGYTYKIKLSNIDANFYLYERANPLAPICSSSVDANYLITEALRTGVCYAVDLPPEEINGLPIVTLSRRAYYKTLKFCTMQKVNSALCVGGQTYGLYLKNKERYFPHMTREQDPIGCFSDIGLAVKDALSENYCY